MNRVMMKHMLQLLAAIGGLAIVGFSAVDAAPVSSAPRFNGAPAPEFTYQYQPGKDGSIDGSHWVPGKRATSVSFPQSKVGLERFIEAGEGVWAAVPLSLTANQAPARAGATVTNCGAEGCADPDGQAAEPVGAALAVAGFAPGAMAELLGSLVPALETPTSPDSVSQQATQAFLGNAVTLVTLLAATAAIVSIGWWLKQSHRARRRRARPFRRRKVSAEEAIRGFVSPATYRG